MTIPHGSLAALSIVRDLIGSYLLPSNPPPRSPRQTARAHGVTSRSLTMIRNTLIAAAIALGTLGAAQAQDNGPRLIGTGNNAQLVYPVPSANVVGGGVASLTGTGDNARLAY